MNDILVHRPARRPINDGPPAPVRLSPPPALADASSVSNWTYALFPVLGSAGILVIALVNNNPLYLIAGGVFVLGSIGMGVAMFLQMKGRTREQRFDERTRYFDHLAATRRQLHDAADQQRARALTTHPDPATLLAVVTSSSRLWERRPDDEDFLLLRVGKAEVPALALPLLPEPEPTRQVDPAAQEAATRLVAANARVADVPVAVPLHEGTTTLVGDPVLTRALARAMVAQLAALHAPDDVRIAVCAPAGPDAVAAWSWLKWLPHAQHPGLGDDGRGQLLLAADAASLAELLHAELERRRNSVWARGAKQPAAAAAGPALVVVVDGDVPDPDPFLGAEGLGIAQIRLVRSEVAEPAHVDLTLRLSGTVDDLRIEALVRDRGERRSGLRHVEGLRGDALSAAEAEVLARRLAPMQLSRQVGEVALSEVSGLPDLLGIDDVGSLDPRKTWQRRPERALLRVPLGVDSEGQPVELDLKESALSGMGPHGLAVGATGSGKSELLRTVVTGLAITHSPDDLAMILVDFKGGATFAGLADLPHVAGMITDLEDDPATIDRVADALRGEMRRRERLLRDSGDLASIREHRQRRLAGAELPAMPHLLVVVDEFSELLVQQPEFIDLFVTIGRLGRSLGVHLLLATQRLEEGKLKGLDSHLSYRLALRTFSAGESRTVIGNHDAFELPAVPGSAYLKVDTTIYQRLRVSTVSTPYVAPSAAATPSVVPRPRLFTAFGSSTEDTALPAIGLDLSDPNRLSTLDVAVRQIAAAAEKVHQVWLPPLPAALPLAQCVGRLKVSPERGVTAGGPVGRLRAPVGLIDYPDRQRQEVYALDLTSSGGHLGVAGAPQTGKTTLLTTLVLSLALTHTPIELQVYCLDLGGGGLAGLDALPHVGGVASRRSPELMRRTVTALTAMLDEREQWFAEQGVTSIEALRARRSQGETGGDAYGDVLLVVDGWAALRADHEDLEIAITALAVRGPAYGFHLVVSTGRWLDLRPALKDSLGIKVELRMGDSGDTVYERKAARTVPADAPGRMLVAGSRRVQVALPLLVVPGTDESKLADVRDASTVLRDTWQGPPAPPVRLLPPRVLASELPVARSSVGVPIGLRESDMGPACLDLFGGSDPHLLVLGDAGSGKTAALRTLVSGLTSRWTPEELRVVVVDYRRTLLDAVGDDHLSQYCASAPAAAGTLADLAEKLAKRLPGPEVTRAQLRAGDWWTGPRALVLVDDHDLVAAPSGDPLGALVELLPVARDVGLHVVLARASGGIGLSLMQPTLRRLRELGTPGLLLSGSAEEGVVLHGARMEPFTPGRARYVARQGVSRMVQVAWTPPQE